MLDPKMHYLPDPHAPALEPFAKAFVGMMFAHAALEARIRELQGVVTGERAYGELLKNPWPANKRAACMTKLITDHLGQTAETMAIADWLARSTALSWERNLLAHGEWWTFDPAKLIITIRSGTDRPNAQRHQQRTVEDINRTTSELMDVEAELYKLQSRIEARRPGA
jgi:hypothetical protein